LSQLRLNLEQNKKPNLTFFAQSETRPPRLFECSDASGNFKIEEVVGDWTQSDLNPDNVMLLDAWTALYVWIGEHCVAVTRWW